MKKIIIITLTIFYLIIISGINISMHYCGGHLKEISLFNKSDETGCCGKTAEKSSCCHDHTTLIKVKDKHFSGDDVKIQFSNISINHIEVFNDFIKTSFSQETILTIANYHAPPIHYKTPIYLKNRVLII